MTVEIREHALGSKQAIAAFFEVQELVYADDPVYVPPLRMELRDRLTPGKNPLWQHAEGVLFTAHRDGKLVGRISAQVDREHLRIHRDDAGFFGFFDTLDDSEVAGALLDAACAWLRAKGMKVARGPFSFTINEESGLLVDGFDTPPALMMAHHRPYQQRLVEESGFAKVKDLLSWKYVVEPPPPRAQRAWEQMNALPEVRFRSVDPSRMREELDHILEIFNDAWSNNWGFVPATEAEIEKMAEDFKILIDPRIAFFAEVKGRPVGMVICLPNLPEILRGGNGSLLPTLWAKLLWHLKIKKDIRSGRLMVLGIRQEMRGLKRYGALSTAMYAELAHRGLRHGFEWAELSWTLEDNRPINLGIQAMRGKVYKTYRVYEKPL